MLLQLAPSHVIAQATPPFPDMDRSWYRYQDSVAFLKSREVIGGYEDGTFKPKSPVNRAEFLKIVFAARGGNEPVAGECFTDVPEDAWFAPFICAAKRRGIVNGYPDGTFKPEQIVNIAEAMKMVLQAYGREVSEGSGEDWYESYAKILDREDIFPRHSYLPWEPMTRERAADLIARFVRHDEERWVPRMSPGCGKAEVRNAPSQVTVNGIDRSFLLTTPDRYVNHDAHPLIIAFHGRTNSNEMVRSYFGLDRATEDYFIAYPAALQKDTGTFHWSDPGNTPSQLRDIAFFDEIVKTLGETYCIDMDRIFVAGHSLGAWFANSIACVRGDVVRGSATLGGSSVITDCSGPSAAMIINNPDDTLSPHKSVEMVRDMRLEENFCQSRADNTQPQSLLCQEYVSCDGGNVVVWCPHDQDRDNSGTYYPHQWPRETGGAMIDFFDTLK